MADVKWPGCSTTIVDYQHKDWKLSCAEPGCDWSTSDTGTSPSIAGLARTYLNHWNTTHKEPSHAKR